MRCPFTSDVRPRSPHPAGCSARLYPCRPAPAVARAGLCLHRAPVGQLEAHDREVGDARAGHRKGSDARRRRGGGQMPARKAPASRARRVAPRPTLPRLPELEQRQLDLLGLGMVALGVFFGFLVYGHSDGGEAGGWTVDSMRWLLGAVHYAVPPVLVAVGALIVMRPVLPAVRPIRAGGICLFAAL